MSQPAYPLALVYRGRAARPDECSGAVAALLRSSRHDFDVRYVGPREELSLTSAVLARAALYSQPGGGGLDAAYRHMRKYKSAIRAFVAAGGRYLGFCLGGYLAGATPGLRAAAGRHGPVHRHPGRHGHLGARHAGTGPLARPAAAHVLPGRSGLPAPAGRSLASPSSRAIRTTRSPRSPPRSAAAWSASSDPTPRPRSTGTTTTASSTPTASTTDLGHDLIDAVMGDRGTPTPYPRSAPR